MATEITVQLFPAAGGGVQVANTPQGPIPVPIPFMSYERVREIVNWDQNGIRFVTRAGDEIMSNIPYLVKWTNVAEGSA
jgi:hypothetical protein